VSSAWRKVGSTLQLDVTVPANATGLVYVPGTSPDAVTEVGSGRSVQARKADGVDLVGVRGGHVVFSVGSGSYAFRAPAS
jgi:alpha-L-rhamnosidase